MRYVIVIVLAACATHAPALPSSHPANPGAPAGRLAGPPPAFANVSRYPDVPPLRTDEPAGHHHHP